MRKNLCRVLAIAVVGLLGVTAFAEEMDNPQYTGWAKMKPGTEVTMKMESATKMQGTENKMTSTITKKLVEVTPTEATVETTTKMSMAGMDMPASTTTDKIKAKIEKPAAAADAPKAEVKEGTDKVEIAGKSYNAKTTETTMDSNGSKTTSKTWTSDEMPGGMIKMESTTTGTMDSKTTMAVTDVKTP